LSRSNSPTGLGARLFRIAASTFPGNFARSHIEEMTTTF
jgi:hypothetical protein